MVSAVHQSSNTFTASAVRPVELCTVLRLLTCCGVRSAEATVDPKGLRPIVKSAKLSSRLLPPVHPLRGPRLHVLEIGHMVDAAHANRVSWGIETRF